MACHHHHHDHSHQYKPLTGCSSCCCCSCTSPHPSSASESPTTDPFLQAIATLLFQSGRPQHYVHNFNPQEAHHQKHPFQKQHQNQHYDQTQSLLSSLLRRIDALESSLHFSATPPPPLPRPNSLRDFAARTIQTHFRAFLVRRSRILRQLKELAFIKSSLDALKFSVSNSSRIKSQLLSQKAMDLLFKLDSIHGGDQMIRDGKKSISRDLVGFLEFIDELSMKRQELYSKSTKNARFAENRKQFRDPISAGNPFSSREMAENGIAVNHRGLSGDQRAFLEKLRSQVEEIQGSSENDEESVELEAFHQISDDEENTESVNYGRAFVKNHGLSSKSKKSVRFAENGNLSRVFISNHELFPGEDGAGIVRQVPDDDRGELEENMCREIEEIGAFSRVSEGNGEAHMENKGCAGDRNPRRNVRMGINYGIRTHCQDQNGNFTFSAPLPVQMEPILRTDLMKKEIVRPGL